MEGHGSETEEMVPMDRCKNRLDKQVKRLKVASANVDGIISARVEINLRFNKPDIMYFVETKLCEKGDIKMGDNNYKLWTKDGNTKWVKE